MEEKQFNVLESRMKSTAGVLQQTSYLEVTFPIWYCAPSPAQCYPPSLDRVMVSLLWVEFYIGHSTLEDGTTIWPRSDASAVPLRTRGISQVSCFLCPTQPQWSSSSFQLVEFVKSGDCIT